MSAERIAKLRRMAEHPTSNPHEATIAREEMERLIAAGHVEDRPMSWSRVDHSRGMDDFAASYLETLRRDARCFICEIRLNYGWASSISMDRCPKHLKVKTPGNAGYYEWARTLQLGVAVEVQSTRGGDRHRLTIERMTTTQYIMSNGSRFRRAGKYPGYKVGENGHHGRTYLVEAIP